MIPPAPSADKFARYPASWYLFGASADIARQPVSKQMLGRKVVAYRTGTGRAVVMDGSCAHLGADLGCGKVVGETLQCPFHGWRYGPDGFCSHVPRPVVQTPNMQRSALPFVRLRVYPAVERHGYLFFFNGREPLFPLPFFWGEDPKGFVAGKPFTYTADCNWCMNASHAFDIQRFASVHDRELTAAPVIDSPAAFARRNSYHARVVGRHLMDRLRSRFAGRTVHITTSVCGGTIVLVTGNFGGTLSRFLLACQPLENGQTLCEGICFAPHSSIPGVERLSLAIRRAFTHGYLLAQTSEIRGAQYRPENLGLNDREMIEYFQWVAALPQSAQIPIPDSASDQDHEEMAAADLAVPPSVPAAARAVTGAHN